MGFPRQEYWSGLPFPSPGHLPHAGTELHQGSTEIHPGIKPRSPALQADSLLQFKNRKIVLSNWLCHSLQKLFAALIIHRIKHSPKHIRSSFQLYFSLIVVLLSFIFLLSMLKYPPFFRCLPFTSRITEKKYAYNLKILQFSRVGHSKHIPSHLVSLCTSKTH